MYIRRIMQHKLSMGWLACLFMLLPVMGQSAETLPAAATGADVFAQALAGLKADDFDQKEIALRQLAQINDPRVLDIFKAMQEAHLYYSSNGGELIYLNEATDPPGGVKVLNGEKLTDVDPAVYDKVSVNNQLRTVLKELIAGLNLHSPDRTLRLAAVNELVGDVTPEKLALFNQLLLQEKDAEIAEVMQVAIAIADLDGTDNQARLKALQRLSGSLRPEAYNRIQSLLTDLGSQTDAMELRAAATQALNSIDSRREKYRFIETTIFGLSLGSILLLIAIGLSITFGVMGVINMAHGELMMLGAYTTYLVQAALPNAINYSLFIAIPLAFLISGLVGIAIERGVIRFLYGRPLETLLATFGISLILQQIPRTFISAQNVTVQNPSWLSGSWVINPALSITYNRLFIFGFAIVVFFGLLAIMKKTSLGLQVRAVSQNRAMAKAMGVRTEWVDALTFGLGSGIAGIAGVALSQITNVGPNLGQGYIVDSFMVVVFGGVGNVWGMLVGSLSLGTVSKYLEPWSGAVLAKILILIFIILFIQKRPRGLFPQKGRAAEA